MNLSEIGEFGLIRRIRATLPHPHEPVILGIGDDAAAIRQKSGYLTIITSDMFLEGIHFDYSLSDSYQIGSKALLVNISDIAAMGGRPTSVLISVGLPEGISTEDFDGIFNGLKESARRYGISIVGGDTCRSESGLILSIALLGEVEEGIMVLRSGAKKGDAIFVTGTLGDSAMGLELLKKKVRGQGSGVRTLIERHLLPNPRVEEGEVIAKNKWATSMIDISDGLTSDLCHICDESGAGARIYKERIPISPELKEASALFKTDPLSYALRGGEDYELLFTVSEDKVEDVMKAEIAGRPLATMIGEIVEGERTIIDRDGNKNYLVPSGYDHFASYLISK